MPRFDIGRYTYNSDNRVFHKNSDRRPAVQSDIDDRAKSYDNMLHQSLEKIYRERRSASSSSSSRTKKFCPDSQYNNDWKSIIKPILEQESILSEHFSKKEFEKFSLLWIAVLAGYEKSAELLVRSGADVNELFGHHDPQVADEKWTVLHVLLQMPFPKNERLIRLVADHGADLNARDHKGCTVLHLAVENGLVQMTEMLLKKGSDVNAVVNDGDTSLIFAVCNSDKELVTLLMKYGADIFVKNINGENLLHYLRFILHQKLAVSLARVLIEKGVSVDDKDHNHFQPIHHAAADGCNKLVKLYLDHGTNVNALTKWNESPLYKAARFGKNTVVETLLERGANIHLRTKGAHTALHAICHYYVLPFNRNLDERNCEIGIRLLLSAGADVLAEDRDGLTPFATRIRGLRNERQPGQECWPLIEALALKKALQPSIELKDEMIIVRYQKLQDYYQRCSEEIDRMKLTRFTENCTAFQLVTKSQRQIAVLMRNPDFETQFSLHDLNDFSLYAIHLRGAFERAKSFHHSLLEQENVINEAVYYILPDLVVRKVVHYIFN